MLFIAVGGVIFSFLAWLFLLATRELIYILIHIEENTRNTAERIDKGIKLRLNSCLSKLYESRQQPSSFVRQANSKTAATDAREENARCFAERAEGKQNKGVLLYKVYD